VTVDPTISARPATARPDRTVSPLLVRALRTLGRGGGRRALDIGPGGLSNTRHLLDRGFAVDVVDRDPAVAGRAAALEHPDLRPFPTDIRRFPIERGRYDVVVALDVMKALPVPAIVSVLAAARAGLADGGVVCCTLLGDRDSWARRGPPATAFSEVECRRLVSGWLDVRLKEIEFDGPDRRGAEKHWHWFALLLSG
jgi:hypothetical protein